MREGDEWKDGKIVMPGDEIQNLASLATYGSIQVALCFAQSILNITWRRELFHVLVWCMICAGWSRPQSIKGAHNCCEGRSATLYETARRNNQGLGGQQLEKVLPFFIKFFVPFGIAIPHTSVQLYSFLYAFKYCDGPSSVSSEGVLKFAADIWPAWRTW